MRKVILKARLANRDKFEQKLSEIDLDFSPIFWQHDRVYVPKGYKRGKNFPRLIMRTEMKAVDRPPKYILLLRRHIEDSGVDVTEETVVKDYGATVGIILQLGFKPVGEVSRRRQALTMGKSVIYVDKIDNVNGYFAKIELTIKPEDKVSRAKEELVKTFESLGERNFVEKSYLEISESKKK